MQNDAGQGVVGRELLEHGFVGGHAAAGGFFQAFGGNAHFAEQNFLQLFGRIEVEGLAGNFAGLLFKPHQFGAQFVALAGKLVFVDEHAVALHDKQHFGHGQLEFFIHFKLLGIHLRFQTAFDAQGKISVLRGIFGGLLHGHIGKRNLLGAFAAQAFIGNGGQAEPAFGQFVQTMPQMAFHNIGSEHGIAGNAV